jgi:hypothetical protein
MSEYCDLGFPNMPQEVELEGSSELLYAMQEYDGMEYFGEVNGAANIVNVHCADRREGMAQLKAREYMRRWGLAYNRDEFCPNDEYARDGTWYSWDCSAIGCGAGCGGGEGAKLLDYATAANMMNCEVIEKAMDEALIYMGDWYGLAGDSSSVGATSRRNAMNGRVWEIIYNWFSQVHTYQDTQENTCDEDEVTGAYDDYQNDMNTAMDEMGEPMSNGTLALIVMGGALGMILVITKFVGK